MPQEFRQVNGKWVLTGSASSDEITPTARPAAPTPKAKPKPKPRPKPRGFLQTMQNHLAYEIKQIRKDPLGTPARNVRRLGSRVAAVAPNVTRPLTMEGNLAQRAVAGAVAAGQLMMRPNRQAILAGVGAGDNALQLGQSLWQRHVQKKAKADPSGDGFGQAREQWVDTIYGALGAKRPSEMNEMELMGDQARRSLGLAGIAAVALPAAGVGGALAATTKLGKVAQFGKAVVLNETVTNYFDDNTGGNIVNLINSLGGLKLPGAVDVGNDDWLDAGNKSLLPNAAPGAALGTMGAFANTLRRLKAGGAVAEVTAARQRLIDQGLIEKTDTGYRFTPKAAEKPQTMKEANDAMEARIAGIPQGADDPAAQIARNNAEIERLRAQLPPDAAPIPELGVRRTGPNYAEQGQDQMLYQEWLAKNANPATPEAAPALPGVRLPDLSPAQLDEAAAGATAPRPALPPMADGPAPTPIRQFTEGQPSASPEPDPWADVVDTLDELDPSLPELDTVARLTDELDDEELLQIAAGDGPVVDQIARTLEQRPAAVVDPNLRTDLVAAPTDRLSEIYMDGFEGPTGTKLDPWATNIDSLNDAELRSLANPANSPDLYERILSRTGKDWEDLTKMDILEGMRELSANGRTVMPGRLGQTFAPAADIDAEPARFQFKENTNEAGEQFGNSLSGVGRWNPYAEGTLLVWRDPDGGRLKVVDGHNRLALAKRIGIPSVPIEELFAPNAGAARAQGALSNIGKGGGTAFDAAKFIRETGMNSPEQLQAAGIPLNSGWGRQGLALSRLPDDMFKAVVDEIIPLRKGVIIGDSGADPDMMRTAFGLLLKEPEMSEGTLRELIQMGIAAPKVNVDQGGFDLGINFNEGMKAKASLVLAVRDMLTKEKNIFGRTAKNGEVLTGKGNTIDKVGAEGISSEATRALTLLEEQKYLAGPVGDLLNEGTALVAAGQRAGDVAKGIKNRLAASLKTLMGEEVEPATDVLQGDMLSGGPGLIPAEDVPVVVPEVPVRAAMPAEDRAALQADILQRATSGREVRVPATPEPQLPEPPQVELREAIAEIQAKGGVEPGSKAAQALADEIRLADDYRRADALTRQDTEDSLRDAFSYEAKTFDEKKNLGMADDWGPIDLDKVSNDDLTRAMDLYQAIPDLFPGKRWVDPRKARAEATSPQEMEDLYQKFRNQADPEAGERQAERAELRLRAEREKQAREILDAARLRANMRALGATDNEVREVLGLPPVEGGNVRPQSIVDQADEVLPTEVLPRADAPRSGSIADAFGATMRAMAESDARLYRGLDETIKGIKAGLDELGGAAPAAPSQPQRRLLQALADGDTEALAKVKKVSLAAAEKKGWVETGPDGAPSITDAGRVALEPPGPRKRKLALSEAGNAGGPVLNEATKAPAETIKKQLAGGASGATEKTWAELVADINLGHKAASKEVRGKLKNYAQGLDQIDASYQAVADAGDPERLAKLDTRRMGMLKQITRILDDQDAYTVKANEDAMNALRTRAQLEGCN